jgi:transposase
MMNGTRYRKVLEDKLEFFMHQHQTTHFLQDGAPCNTSKIVTKWFADRPTIQLIKWPGNSPDLNPIENVWSWMKQKLRDSSAKNLDEWRREILELWNLRMDDIQYLKSLVKSMPRRLQEVIDREGWTTKY